MARDATNEGRGIGQGGGRPGRAACPRGQRPRDRTFRLDVQPLEARLALAVEAVPAIAAVDVVGPRVAAFSSPVVAAGRVTVVASFTEPVFVRGRAVIPVTIAGVPGELAVRSPGWPARALAFTALLPAGRSFTAADVAVPAGRIVLPRGGTITDRTHHPAVSLARPVGLALSAASIPENAPAATVVGSLSAADADGARDRLAYALVPGAGSADNAAFRIVAGRLVATVPFDFEIRTSASVRIRVTDSGGLSAERSFTIAITDVADTFVTGRVADGYLAEARIFADTNGNRRLDTTDTNHDFKWNPGEGEAWTDTDGAGWFTGFFGGPSATLVTTGGRDASTGIFFPASLTAPSGATIVNALTTVLVAVRDAAPGLGLAGAEKIVKAGLGLPAGIDLTTYDPLARGDLGVQRVAGAVANVLVAAARHTVGEATVVANLAALLLHARGPVDLADPATLTGIFTAGGKPPDPVGVGFLAQDNRDVFRARTMGEIFAAERTSQAEQVTVADHAPVSTIIYDFFRHNPLHFGGGSVGTPRGEDASFFTVSNGTLLVRLVAPPDFQVKPIYRFTLFVYQYPGHLRPALSGEVPVTVRVLPPAA